MEIVVEDRWEAHGFECVLLMTAESLRGFVGVSRINPLFGVCCDEMPGGLQPGSNSLSYSASHLPDHEPDGSWWLGFEISYASGIYRAGDARGDIDRLAKQLADYAVRASGRLPHRWWEGVDGHLHLKRLYVWACSEKFEDAEIAYMLGKPWKWTAELERLLREDTHAEPA